ncbi:MAG: bifunctional folylpolyglutamate synthase/dihydrofolate synthase [Eubacteriaceae bacterium]|nr:bifunctional folylpolyglutamate synthase/dihydrofolate synthase [Eubacteriaceae bacterium]
MNYNEALDYIHGTYMFGIKLGLDNISALLEYIGNPHKKLKFIHVAGTNGKGSTCNMLANILKNNGYKTGLYISPFLEEFTERIQVNGEKIKPERLGEVTGKIKDGVDRMMADGYPSPSEFEIVTAIGFQYFYEENADVVVLEVGMGGRFDATNVIPSPIAAVITAIGMDHIQYLGNTIEEIAFEKSGIIKSGSPVVLYPQEEEIINVVRNKALETGSEIIIPDIRDITLINSSLAGQDLKYTKKGSPFEGLNFKLSLLGDHQIMNALNVLAVLEVLLKTGYKISEESITSGMETVSFPGRFEKISEKPLIIIDGAHNQNGVTALTKTLDRYIDRKVNFVLGVLEDKDFSPMVKLLIPYAKKIYTVTPNNPRALKSENLAEFIRTSCNYENVTSFETIGESVTTALASAEDEIFIFAGSLYMIGEARTSLRKVLQSS